MKKITSILFIFLSLNILSQNISITGKVIDKNSKESIPYATISIKSLSSKKIITGGITDENGAFEIKKITEKSFTAEIQFLGYKNFTKEITTAFNRKINLGAILLEESGQSLDEVVVVAERSTIQQKIDRKVINIGKDLTTSGATASDIMRNLPSVSVNQDGEIAMRGNENVRVLIDGKPTNIEAAQLLQQIPSSSIKSIELITSPSAKYNPEGMSGIINIILYKNANLGLNGNFNLGVTQGEKTRFNGALGINYSTGKINFYGNYGNSSGENILIGSVNRFTENFEQLQDNLVDNNSHLYKIGLDYYVNDKNTISIYTNQNIYKMDLFSNINVNYQENAGQSYTQDYLLNLDNNSGTYNFDYKHLFNKNGENIEFEIDYNDFSTTNNTNFNFIDNSANTDYIDYITANRQNLMINLDYVNPLSKNASLELGADYQSRKTDETYNTTSNSLNNGAFIYNRDIYSFYTTFRQKLDRWTYQVGGRLENYNINSTYNEENKNSETFTDNIFSFYPSAFVKYDSKSEKNTYQFNFSRRVDRPSLAQSNPIRSFNTPVVLALGNMRLNPQFTTSVEFNYTNKFKKGSFTLGTFYRKIKDEINRIGYFDPNDASKLILDYDNFSDNNAYGFELSSNLKPISWWNFNTSFDVYSRKQKGTIEGQTVSVKNTISNFKMSHNFKASKNLTFQLFGFYSGLQKILQYEVKPNYFVNMGARYNIKGGKGTFSLNFNDIFKTQRFAFESYRTVLQKGEYRRDTQTINFGFSYRFGGGKNKAIKRKKRDKNEKKGGFL